MVIIHKTLVNNLAVYYSTQIERWVIRDPIKKRYVALSHEDLFALRVALSTLMVGATEEGEKVTLSIESVEGVLVIRMGSEEETKKEIDLSMYSRLEDFGIGDVGGKEDKE